MEAKEYLIDYVKKTTPILNRFFKEKEKEAAKISPICVQMIDVYRDHLRGGKKARGALMVLGYLLGGKKPDLKIYRASVFPEIIQSFLLIHDDVMDQDLIRRGKPTPESFFTALHKKKKFKGDGDHFGLSMAVDLGDLGIFLAQEALWQSGFGKEKIFNVLKLANIVYQNTAFGQALDVFGETSGEFNQEYVFKIHFFKTASYSVSAPLQFGAILSGVKSRNLSLLDKYGQSVGIAFQLQDDILGLFGHEKTLGKKAGLRDVRQGKVTLLIVKALEKAKRKERVFLKKVYGRREIKKGEMERLQEIVRDTGSLAYSQKLSRKLVEKGKKYVPQITSDPKLQDTLYKMADFMIEREK